MRCGESSEVSQLTLCRLQKQLKDQLKTIEGFRMYTNNAGLHITQDYSDVLELPSVVELFCSYGTERGARQMLKINIQSIIFKSS